MLAAVATKPYRLIRDRFRHGHYTIRSGWRRSRAALQPLLLADGTALAHKGLETKTLPSRFTEKERIACSGSERIRVIVDKDRAIADSWNIAEYLRTRTAIIRASRRAWRPGACQVHQRLGRRRMLALFGGLAGAAATV